MDQFSGRSLNACLSRMIQHGTDCHAASPVDSRRVTRDFMVFRILGVPHHDTVVAWHFQCSDAFAREDLLLDKGKPAARQGRKVAGQASSLTAGLPRKDVPVAPREHVGLPPRRPPCPGRTLGLPLLGGASGWTFWHMHPHDAQTGAVVATFIQPFTITLFCTDKATNELSRELGRPPRRQRHL
jgi:hypothetical protein